MGTSRARTVPSVTPLEETRLSGDRRRRLSSSSQARSGTSPATPESELDDAGWTTREELTAAVASQYDWATSDHLHAV